MSIAQYGMNGGFGLTALNKARAAGLSDAQIRQQLSGAGLTIGQAAGSALGANTDLYQYSGGSGGFGATALGKAQAAGMTLGQIRTSLAMSGLRIGDLAGQSLNVDAGKTYFGYAPNIDRNNSSYTSTGGGSYPLRPQLAPRGAVTDGSQSQRLGYSPIIYAAGGTDDHTNMNTIFGTNQNAQQIGGGYSDPTFNTDNAVAPGAHPYANYGLSASDLAQIPNNRSTVYNNTGAGVTNTTNASQSKGKTGYGSLAQKNSNTKKLVISNVNL